jgi:hypothetical protein
MLFDMTLDRLSRYLALSILLHKLDYKLDYNINDIATSQLQGLNTSHAYLCTDVFRER